MSKKEYKDINLSSNIYPLFNELEQLTNDIEIQFSDVIFSDGILSAEQEDKMYDFFMNPSFNANVESNITKLDELGKKLNYTLLNKRLGNDLSNKVRYNLRTIYNYQDKMNNLKATKNKLNSKTKEDKSTEKSLILNEASQGVSGFKKDKDKSKGESPKYVDTIGNSENTYLRFHEYDKENNQNVRVSIKTVIDETQLRIEDTKGLSDSINSTLNDDIYLAYNIDNIKQDIVNMNLDLLKDKEWCNDILNDLRTQKNISQLDQEMKNKLETFVSVIQEELNEFPKYSRMVDEKLNDKEKYYDIIRNDIERELNNLFVNEVSNGFEVDKDSNEISVLLEKITIISTKIQRLSDDNVVKKEYTVRLKEINKQLNEKLSKESSKNADSQVDLKISDINNISEEDKKKIAKNPKSIAKLSEALTRGEITTAKGTRKISERERFILSNLLEDVNMYRLESNGLIDIKVDDNSEHKSVDIYAKNSSFISKSKWIIAAKNQKEEQGVELEL